MVKALLVAAALFSGAAMAEILDTQIFGAWTVLTISGEATPSCVAKTYSSTGQMVQANVFPDGNGGQYTTLTVHDSSWHWTSVPATVQLQFASDKYGVSNLTAYPEIKDRATIIFRHLTDNFSKHFQHYSTMTFFPDTVSPVTVRLDGTTDIIKNLDSCNQGAVEEAQ